MPSSSCSSAAEYVFQGPPSIRYCVSTEPEPAAPSCASSVTFTGPFWPAERSSVASVLGAAESTRRPIVLRGSAFGSAALSVAKYSTSCVARPATVNGPL